MNTQARVLASSVELLQQLLDQWGALSDRFQGKDIRRSFINRHAWNIKDIAADVVALSEVDRLGSIYLLGRPALESLFKLSAAIIDKDFAAEKVVAEVEEELEKVNRWQAVADPSWTVELDKLALGLSEFGDDLRKRYSVSGNPRHDWKWIATVAKAGGLKMEYVRDYFIGSKHVHAMLSALTVRPSGLHIAEGLFRLTATVCHAAALVNRALMELEDCAAPRIFEHSLELLDEAERAFQSQVGEN